MGLEILVTDALDLRARNRRVCGSFVVVAGSRGVHKTRRDLNVDPQVFQLKFSQYVSCGSVA